jgi:hypothetical protein
MQELYATIAGLPEDFRLALVAVDVLGLSYREAARALRVREATITTRLFRARKQMARRLGLEHGGEVGEGLGAGGAREAERPPLAPARAAPNAQTAPGPGSSPRAQSAGLGPAALGGTVRPADGREGTPSGGSLAD